VFYLPARTEFITAVQVLLLRPCYNTADRAEPANGPSTTPDDRIKAVQAAYLSSNKSVDPLKWW